MELYKSGIRDDYYKNYCRLLNQRRVKKMHNEKYMSTSNNKQKATWKFIGEYTNSMPKNISILNEREPKSYENVPNEYFIGSGDITQNENSNGARISHSYNSICNS
ncbi:hypothetical protein HHI36_020340 [Cryptolaemus montrouzieri]|uniref:Uncharacterized protein n=1 Tax=Cryptolaemus montrouzieri TaxID=559131 RepID=A0ABD2NB05_9CUCU